MIQLDDDLFFVDYIDLQEKMKLDINNNLFSTPKVSIPIASAITAQARVFRSNFKNHPLIKLFYSDTDSIANNFPLEYCYASLRIYTLI